MDQIIFDEKKEGIMSRIMAFMHKKHAIDNSLFYYIISLLVLSLVALLFYWLK